MHQVNVEYLARVVMAEEGWAFPDICLGTDSHTTMVNGLGVLGWGIGGIEAEAVMLGRVAVDAAPAAWSASGCTASCPRAPPPPTWC